MHIIRYLDDPIYLIMEEVSIVVWVFIYLFSTLKIA